MDIFSSNQNINPNPGQTIPQTPFDGLEALFERILDFNTSNESRDDILRSARNYDLDRMDNQRVLKYAISECGTYSHSNQYDYDFSGNVFEVSYKLLWDISGDPVPTTTPQNTIGHAYWLARFYFVCLYYVLVLGAIVVQVYGGIPRVSLFGVYIAIIAMASVSLMFKLFRIRRNRRCSPYDVIDIAVFTLPLAGSVTQIQNIMSMNEKGDISFLSFSVLVIFLHCLFELRIKRRICYFVTVILEISGIWGSFGKSLDLEGRPAGFDLIMVFFVMLMAMVSLNILIALMNDGFKDAKDTSTAAWIQFKLSYVEEAESITYNIPGFREENAWRVPDVICYTATLQQQENYEKRFQKEDSEKRLEALRADLAEVRQMLSQVLIHAPSSA
ncbi:hypothetical protein EC991_005975 [Linnemannia zychae]|nr:hypothetical protein EC991_005975 [Linnemannia zychae]